MQSAAQVRLNHGQIGNMDKQKVAQLFKDQKDASKRSLSAQYENTDSCWSFYNADQMSYSDRIQFADTFGRKRRAMVNFNKVQQNVDAVAGFMAQNRRQAKFLAHLPQDQRQQLYSRNMNSLYTYHRENTNADQLESDQDLDMLVNGYGAIDTELSYIVGNATRLPNGEIVKKKIDPSNVYWDASAKAKNLEDRAFNGYWQDFPLKDALELFEDSEQSDFEAVGEEEPASGGYIFNPYGGIYSKIKMDNSVEWTSRETEMVRVYKHEWMQYETFYKANNPVYIATTYEDATYFKMRLDMIAANIKPIGDMDTKDLFSFDPKAEVLVFDERTKAALVKEFGALIQPISFKRKAFYTAVCSGSHVFSWFRSQSQQGFSVKFKTGTWNKNQKMWMGMVNPMMEPAKYFNKALTELMFTIAANSKGGVYVEEDAVEDIAKFEGQYAKTDGVIVVNAGALSNGKIQDKTRPAVPTGLENIITLSEANISSNGVDPAFMGNLDKEDQSGILYKRRIRQVISKFARYFDSITLYQKEEARQMADLIPIWVQNNQGTWVRVTGEDGADEFVQIMEDMLAPEYDVTIQESSLSSDEKQETAIMLSGYGDKLMLAGDPQGGKAFLAESLDFMRLDGDVKGRLRNILTPKEQAVDPQQFMMMQQQLQELQRVIQSGQLEKVQSETAKNKAMAVKTMEEAKRTAIEADMAADASNVTINI